MTSPADFYILSKLGDVVTEDLSSFDYNEDTKEIQGGLTYGSDQYQSQ